MFRITTIVSVTIFLPLLLIAGETPSPEGTKTYFIDLKDGDKIKFFPLRQPNIYQSNVMSFITDMPKEFNVNDIIDYDTQFDKAFIEPLNLIIERIGWKVDKSYGTQLSLEDFFG